MANRLLDDYYFSMAEYKLEGETMCAEEALSRIADDGIIQIHANSDGVCEITY